jgi:uncharacterized protein (DUF427 family)
MTRPAPDPVSPGQESVWAYPRPAVAQDFAGRVQILHRGCTLADARHCVRTLETSHPPSYYLPRAAIAMERLTPSPRRSLCEWKAQAVYFDVAIDGALLPDAAWSYPEPTSAFESLRNHIAFYATPFDACLVDGERVTPQPGAFYGGWITANLARPFKGGAGSAFW